LAMLAALSDANDGRVIIFEFYWNLYCLSRLSRMEAPTTAMEIGDPGLRHACGLHQVPAGQISALSQPVRRPEQVPRAAKALPPLPDR